jgi:hypothetical protein
VVGIPFTQYVLPHGERRDQWIYRPDDIEALAQQFIDAGGRYECEVLTTGHVSLTAVHEIDGEEQDIAIEVCGNGPDVPVRVDKLVRDSVAFLSEERKDGNV